jgi:hypothetical protein
VSGFGRGHVRGVLGSYGEGFRAKLLSRGYSWGSAAHKVHLMAHFSRWLEANRVGLAQVDRSVVIFSLRLDGPRVT